MEDFKDLVNFRIPTKENSLMSNLIKNTSHRPNINSRVVNFSPKQYFRSPIPKSDNLMGVLLDGIVISASESKISQFNVEFILSVDEDVLRFEVSVDDAVGMAEF